MSISITLPQNYGYPALVALGVIPLASFAHGMVVGVCRRAAKIPYPNCYATHEQAKENKDAYKFNCAQRAHANFLENMPQTMAYVLFSGLVMPVAAAAVGVSWLVLRGLFAYGYIMSNKPNGNGRYTGGLFWAAQGGLWGMSIYTALKMIS